MENPTVLILIGAAVAIAVSAPSALAKEKYSPEFASNIPDEITLISANREMERTLFNMATERMIRHDPSKLKTTSNDPSMTKLKAVFDQLAQVRASIMCTVTPAGKENLCTGFLAKSHQRLLDEVDALEPLDPGAIAKSPALRAKSFQAYRLKRARSEDVLDGYLKKAMEASPKPVPQPIRLVFDKDEPKLIGLPTVQAKTATSLAEQTPTAAKTD